MAVNVTAKKRAGIVLIIVGVILLGTGLIPDTSDITSRGFGVADVTGIVVGLAVIVVGFLMTRKKGHLSEPPV